MAEPRTRAEAVFTTTALVVDLGSRLVDVGKDWAETDLVGAVALRDAGGDGGR